MLKTENAGVIDLFCGIGGLSNGFYQEDFKILAGIDADSSCKYAFEANNDSVFIDEKIEDVKSSTLKNYFKEKSIKILVGCAPCQPFSSYMFKDAEKKDNKWTLLYDFSKLIKETSPDIISMENVPQLMNFKKAPVLKDFIKSLEDLNYYVSYQIVYCPNYGIPQNRKRFVLLASRYGPINLIDPTHGIKNYITVKDAIGNLQPLSDGEESTNDRMHRARKLTPINKERILNTPYGGGWKNWPEHLKLTCHKKAAGKTYMSVYGRMKWEEPSPTITTHCTGYGNGRFGHPEQHRAITLREAALLQTFPLGYKFYPENQPFSSTKIARQIGNAVPVELGRIIAKSIKVHLKEYQKHEDQK
jgi:DNA (cytosine-5)-methyltransferase 1